MERFALPDLPANGGLPEPPAGRRVRVAVARHPACGAATRIRLPDAVPASAIRRLRCAGCDAAYETEATTELRVEPPRAPAQDPESPGWRLWRWASVPLGAAAVIGALLLIQAPGGGG